MEKQDNNTMHKYAQILYIKHSTFILTHTDKYFASGAWMCRISLLWLNFKLICFFFVFLFVVLRLITLYSIHDFFSGKPFHKNFSWDVIYKLYSFCCIKLKPSQTFTRTACLVGFVLSFSFFFPLLCRSWLSSDTHFKGFPFMSSPSLDLVIYAQLWHLRDPLGRGDRKMDDRDISARNYCYCRRAQILACIRAEEGCKGWEGGEAISSVTNLVFTLGQEGKVI